MKPQDRFNSTPASIPFAPVTKGHTRKVRHPEFKRLGGGISGWSGERVVRRRGKGRGRPGASGLEATGNGREGPRQAASGRGILAR